METFRGQWSNGKWSGSGRIIYANNDEYEGEVKHGQREGQGRCQYLSGTVYTGAWVDDMRHGQGSQQEPDGESKHKMLLSVVDGRIAVRLCSMVDCRPVWE